MDDQMRADGRLPARVVDVSYTPVSEEPAAGSSRLMRGPEGSAAGARGYPHMSFSGRMFNVGWKGWIRLGLICVSVGAVFQAGGFDPFSPGFTVGDGLGQIVNGVIAVAAFAAQMGALPLALGAMAVLPAWILWRALVTLIGADRPPGPEDRILPARRRHTPPRD